MKHERTKSKTKGSTKKVAAKDPTTNAHQVRLAELNTRQGATANDFFKSFYHRVAENRAKEAKKTPTEPHKIKPV